MTLDKIVEILKRLRVKTAEGSATWAPIDIKDIDGYRTEIGAHTLFLFVQKDGADQDYVVTLTKGDKFIERFTDTDLRNHMEGSYTFLSEFFREVRGSAK